MVKKKKKKNLISEDLFFQISKSKFFAITSFAIIEEITPGGAGTGTLLDRDKL